MFLPSSINILLVRCMHVSFVVLRDLHLLSRSRYAQQNGDRADSPEVRNVLRFVFKLAVFSRAVVIALLAGELKIIFCVCIFDVRCMFFVVFYLLRFRSAVGVGRLLFVCGSVVR